MINSASIVDSAAITYDKRSSYIGFIRGSVYFLDGSVLHFREFVDVQHGTERYTYVYHYQQSTGELIFRYDNAPHFPDLSTFHHHKHERDEGNVIAASEPDLHALLREISGVINI